MPLSSLGKTPTLTRAGTFLRAVLPMNGIFNTLIYSEPDQGYPTAHWGTLSGNRSQMAATVRVTDNESNIVYREHPYTPGGSRSRLRAHPLRVSSGTYQIHQEVAVLVRRLPMSLAIIS